MINRVTGEITFRTGLHIAPQTTVLSSIVGPEAGLKIRTWKLSLDGWKRHVFGFHTSEHGVFEVEALSTDEERIQLVMLAHQHKFYLAGTPEDADRKMFHEGVMAADLGGQKEFSWGEVTCRFAANQNWLVIAYSRNANVPLVSPDVLLHLCAHANPPA